MLNGMLDYYVNCYTGSGNSGKRGAFPFSKFTHPTAARGFGLDPNNLPGWKNQDIARRQ